MKALLIHGPNLNLLGRREMSVYGPDSLDRVNERIQEEAASLGVEVEAHQTAREGEIIELLHAGIDRVDGCLLNPGAYSHTSRAIADAIRAVPYPVIEVHLSNIHAREPWRSDSVTARECHGLVAGFAADSYVLALRGLMRVVERR